MKGDVLNIDCVNVVELQKLRKELHSNPCISGNEKDTARRIVEYLKPLNPQNIYKGIGGNGIVAEFVIHTIEQEVERNDTNKENDEKSNNGNILLRAELDALPIGHRCGHDGHMTILCGVAQWLSKLQNDSEFSYCDKKSRNHKSVYLLFQPEEEIGTGAKKMVEDINKYNIEHPQQTIEYEWVFAIHNWPGFKENSVIVFPDCYAWGSVGMKIKFTGTPAHASEPENSSQIGNLISNFVLAVSKLNTELAFSTCIGIKMGEENFGTAPGEGIVCLTVRGVNEKLLSSLIEQIKETANKISTTTENDLKRGAESSNVANNCKIDCSVSFCDEFPPTMNHSDANTIVESVAQDLDLEIVYNRIGDRGSDDFCYLAQGKKSAFFNLGAGENRPPIHSCEFEFNDNLIKTGVAMFCGIIEKLRRR